MGDTRQENDSILGQDPKNCLLNAAVRLTFTEDLVVKHGWTYFYRTTWGKKGLKTIVLIHWPSLHAAVNKRSLACKLNCHNGDC